MFRQSMGKCKASAEAWAGRELSQADLKASIAKHNRQPGLVRELHNLKRSDPPLASGSETLQVMIALASLSLDQGIELLTEVIAEIKERPEPQSAEDKKRIMVHGACLDSLPLIRLIEEYDATVVINDDCMGARTYFRDVPLWDDPMAALTERYADLTCPRTFREAVVGEFKKDHAADLQTRYAHSGKYIEKWGVEGAVIELVRFRDPFGYEVPELKEYLTSRGIPSLYLEMEYTTGSLAPLKTRVQTFLENLFWKTFCECKHVLRRH